MFRRVIVLFPKFERLDLIQQLREKYDPLARLIAPHITLVGPFESRLTSAALQDHMREVLTETEAFPVTLQGIRGHDDEYLFLNVARGGEQITDMRDGLYSGPLRAFRLPQYAYIPHLTVGRIGDRASYLQAVADVSTFDRSFHCWINEVFVYHVEPDGARPIDFSVPL